MKKIMTLSMSFILALTMILSGCSTKDNSGPKASSNPSSNAGSNPSTDPTSEAGTFPIVEEKMTIKVMVAQTGFVDSYEDNEFTRWLEEKTNIHIDWEVVPAANVAEKFNVAMATGDLPDLFLNFYPNPTQMAIYGGQGLFLSLNSYIDQYGVETKKMFEAVPIAKDMSTANDGQIYGLPNVNDCFHCSMSAKMWVNKVWLDKVGLELPTTPDEFYTMLKAFKEKDPNGNGKPDELPLVSSKMMGNKPNSNNFETFLMNAFIYNNFDHLLLNNKKIEAAYTKPEWKEGLTFIRKLYAEGLIAPESFTQDTSQMKSLFENQGDHVVGTFPALAMSVVANLGGTRWLDYEAIAPLKGPGGAQYTWYRPFFPVTGAAIITNKAENPEAIFRMLDFLYSEEATMRNVYGVKDMDWKAAAEGAVGLDGNAAKYESIVAVQSGTINKHAWNQVGSFWNSSEMRLGFAQDFNEPSQERLLYNETLHKYEPYKPDLDMLVPPLYFTQEQSTELATLEKTILDFVAETYTRFVTGDLDIEKDWDSYLATLDKMNVKRYLQIYQEAYDAKYKN